MKDHSPVSQVLLKIETALQEEIISDSGLKFYLDPSYNKPWQASVTATIAKLPFKVSPKHQKVIDQLKEGDEICMSYRVVADFEFKGDGARFMLATEENDYVKEFYNGRGEMLRVYALPVRKGIQKAIWCGILQNKRREFVDGVQGTESDVSRWLSQFPMGKTDIYSFNNFFEYNGEDYWKCEIDDIFCKRVKGHLVAVGNRIICKPIEEDAPPEVLQQVQHHSSVKLRYQDRGRVISGGKSKGIKKEDIISFAPNHCEKYSFYGMDYFLINENFVLGKWNKNGKNN